MAITSKLQYVNVQNQLPVMKVYKRLLDFNYLNQIDPYFVLKNVFTNSKFINIQEKQNILKECLDNSFTADYIIAKMYLLSFVKIQKQNEMKKKIRQMLDAKKIDGRFKSRSQMWIWFKNCFTIDWCRKNFDDAYVGSIVFDKTPKEKKTSPARKSTSGKHVSWNDDHQKRCQLYIDGLDGWDRRSRKIDKKNRYG